MIRHWLNVSVCLLFAAGLASGCSVRGDSVSPTPTSTPDDVFVIVTPTPRTPSQEPATSGDVTRYVVQPGDNLLDIADRFGVTIQALQEANDIEDPDNIYAGQVLTIPEPES